MSGINQSERDSFKYSSVSAHSDTSDLAKTQSNLSAYLSIADKRT